MIIKLDKSNIRIINNSILNEETVLNDFQQNPFCHYLVYLDAEEKVIAYIYYSDIYERAEINQIEVNVFHRNCGIASKLLEEMIKTVDKNITLEVKEDNFFAIKLYRKYGFKKIGIRKGYYNGIDGILMERKNRKEVK